MNKQFKKVKAVFRPAEEHLKTLKFSAYPLIGKEYIFQYMWVADEGEMFEGTWILQPTPKTDGIKDWYDAEISSVPEFDLEITESEEKL